MQNRDSQRHLSKFGPSGFTMGLKTPVKKALGEKNTFKIKEKNNSNSNVTQEGSHSLVEAEANDHQTKQTSIYLKIDESQRNHN